MEPRQPFCGTTPADIDGTCQGTIASERYSSVIASYFYRRGIREFDKMVSLPMPVRRTLNSEYSTGLFTPVASSKSADSSVKYLFRTNDGREFETVFIPDGKRNTVCVSTQCGCRMGCPFCLTGTYGFKGNLSAGEIINQVISIPDADKVTHVVFMGMGEPLDNIEAVLKSCAILTAQWGLAISSRNITVSTVGITEGVRRFLFESECNLTLSLFSPFPSERAAVVPAEKKYPASGILSIMNEYKLRKKRRLSVAYVMIKEVNDTDKHLESLKSMLSGTSVRVNLLPYHPAGDERFIPSERKRMDHFRDELVSSGISASLRRSRGSDISAACGLLASGLKK
jgi:23S rRNA (adenine2503-C2)-methyltransferase